MLLSSATAAQKLWDSFSPRFSCQITWYNHNLHVASRGFRSRLRCAAGTGLCGRSLKASNGIAQTARATSSETELQVQQRFSASFISSLWITTL